MNKDLFLTEKKLKELFLKYGITIKKEKGQNFLIDFNIITKLVDTIGDDNATLVEIGSGPGNITIFLKDIAERVIGIEIDKEFFPILDELKKRYPNISFLYKDIRKVSWEDIEEKGVVGKVKIVGNIPYYLSSFIIRKLYGWSNLIEEAIIMMPKDVADRVLASPGSKLYGILSVVSQLVFSPKIAFKIKPGSFFPPPKVESVVVKLVPHNTYKIEDEALFFHILNTTFGNRRKMIVNTLKAIISDRDKLIGLLEEVKIDPSIRPEELSVEDFIRLYKKMRYFS